MSSFSKSDLESFREAIWKDYGLKLEGEDLYEAAINLVAFFNALIKFNDDNNRQQKK